MKKGKSNDSKKGDDYDKSHHPLSHSAKSKLASGFAKARHKAQGGRKGMKNAIRNYNHRAVGSDNGDGGYSASGAYGAGVGGSASRAPIVYPTTYEKQVFGMDLALSLENPNDELPLVVAECIKDVLVKKGYLEEGIFRLSSSHEAMMAVKHKYNSHIRVNFAEQYDVHLPACTLKLFLRELPESVFTNSALPEFNNAPNSPVLQTEVLRLAKLSQLINLLPVVNRRVIHEIFALLRVISLHQEYNKMHDRNLAIVFVPAFGINSAALFKLLLDQQDLLFSGDTITRTYLAKMPLAASFQAIIVPDSINSQNDIAGGGERVGRRSRGIRRTPSGRAKGVPRSAVNATGGINSTTDGTMDGQVMSTPSSDHSEPPPLSPPPPTSIPPPPVHLLQNVDNNNNNNNNNNISPLSHPSSVLPTTSSSPTTNKTTTPATTDIVDPDVARMLSEFSSLDKMATQRLGIDDGDDEGVQYFNYPQSPTLGSSSSSGSGGDSGSSSSSNSNNSNERIRGRRHGIASVKGRGGIVVKGRGGSANSSIDGDVDTNVNEQESSTDVTLEDTMAELTALSNFSTSNDSVNDGAIVTVDNEEGNDDTGNETVVPISMEEIDQMMLEIEEMDLDGILAAGSSDINGRNSTVTIENASGDDNSSTNNEDTDTTAVDNGDDDELGSEEESALLEDILSSLRGELEENEVVDEKNDEGGTNSNASNINGNSNDNSNCRNRERSLARSSSSTRLSTAASPSSVDSRPVHKEVNPG